MAGKHFRFSLAGAWCTAGNTIWCSPGTYNHTLQANNSQSCLACPLHTTTLFAGASMISDCVCNTKELRFPLDTHLAQCDHGAQCCGCRRASFECSVSRILDRKS